MPDPAAAAFFQPGDGPLEVDAALACRFCLSGDVDWQLAGDPDDCSCAVNCRRCGARHTLFLTPDQALRLLVHVPCHPHTVPPPPALLAAM